MRVGLHVKHFEHRRPVRRKVLGPVKREPVAGADAGQLGRIPDGAGVRDEHELVVCQLPSLERGPRTPRGGDGAAAELLEGVPPMHGEQRHPSGDEHACDVGQPCVAELLIEMAEDRDRVHELEPLIPERQRRIKSRLDHPI